MKISTVILRISSEKVLVIVVVEKDTFHLIVLQDLMFMVTGSARASLMNNLTNRRKVIAKW